MNSNQTGLIITFIVLGAIIACLGGLFVAQTIKVGELEANLSAREKVVSELEDKLKEYEPSDKEEKEPEKKVSYDEKTVIKATADNGNIGDHVRGKADSKVVVVEYADMSCLNCATIMPHMSSLFNEYGDRVAFVYRHFPLKNNANSQSAAVAVESAGKQGLYWEMLEGLFLDRRDWMELSGDALVDSYVSTFKAVAPNGNEAKFRAELKNADLSKKVTFDSTIGKQQSGVTAAPSVYVNGTLVNLAATEDASLDTAEQNIKKLIEQELNKK